MIEGMMWYDNDPKLDISTRIQRAVAYYLRKFGKQPDICMVHPITIEKEWTKVENVFVYKANYIQPNNFWLGQREDKQNV
jgi:hypothetical protein